MQKFHLIIQFLKIPHHCNCFAHKLFYVSVDTIC